MASNHPVDLSKFLDVANPLFEKIETGLRQLESRTADLTELVALIDPLDTLKDLAQTHKAQQVFYFAQAVSDLLSEILCDDSRIPRRVVLSIQSALPAFADSRFPANASQRQHPISLGSPLRLSGENGSGITGRSRRRGRKFRSCGSPPVLFGIPSTGRSSARPDRRRSDDTGRRQPRSTRTRRPHGTL